MSRLTDAVSCEDDVVPQAFMQIAHVNYIPPKNCTYSTVAQPFNLSPRLVSNVSTRHTRQKETLEAVVSCVEHKWHTRLTKKRILVRGIPSITERSMTETVNMINCVTFRDTRLCADLLQVCKTNE